MRLLPGCGRWRKCVLPRTSFRRSVEVLRSEMPLRQLVAISANPRPLGDVGNEGKNGAKLHRLECQVTLSVERQANRVKR
jgi:hypothetical protein